MTVGDGVGVKTQLHSSLNQNRRAFLRTAVVGAAGVFVGPILMRAAEAKGAPTLDSLLAAHRAATEAHARCLAAAPLAESEGYGRVASLFRAAAKSKEINLGALAIAIKKLGGVAPSAIAAPALGDTRANMTALIQGESVDREAVARARREGVRDAVRALNETYAAGAEYATLFSGALAHLGDWRGAGKPVLVCVVCGFPSLSLPEKRCPTCYVPLDKFAKIA
jgi:rubrerythrin